MPEFVLDASMTMAWCFADEATPYTTAVRRSLADATALAPSIWPLEVANVLLIAERRGRLTDVETQELVAFLHTLPVEVVSVPLEHVFQDILALARAHNLTSYDAAYLALALRENLPLASLDNRLCTAAGNVGVPLVDHARP